MSSFSIFGRKLENMNKKYKTLSILLLSFSTLLFMSNRGGSPGGRTGSTTDASTCATNGGCHASGTSSTIEQDMIATDIPESGYELGMTYTVTVSPELAGVNVWGFEIMAENGDGTGIGTFANNDQVNTKDDGIRATHKFASTTSTGGQTWTMEWTAPMESSGEITFYAAALAANGNGNTNGDDVVINSIVVSENTTASINRLANIDAQIYPNPVTEALTITGYSNFDATVSILTLDGKVLSEAPFAQKISVVELTSGTYILKIDEPDGFVTKRFIKK